MIKSENIMLLSVYHIPVMYRRKQAEDPKARWKLQLFSFACLSSRKTQINFKMIHGD